MEELFLREWPNLFLIIVGYIAASHMACRVYWGFQYDSTVKEYKQLCLGYQVTIGLVFYVLGTVKLEMLQIRIINLIFLAFIVLVIVVDALMYVWCEELDVLIERFIKG